MGSEHAVGWNLLSRLARRFPILLVTQDNEFRTNIVEGVAALNVQGCCIKTYFVTHTSRTDGRKNNLRLGYYLTYYAYQWRVYRLAQELVKQFDVAAAHHLTIVGFREPGFLWKLGLPFIWGPVGGLVYTSRALYHELSPKMRVFQEVRNWITWLQFRFSSRVRAAYLATQRRGGAFIAATPEIGEAFQARFGGHYHWIPETGATKLNPALLAHSSPKNGGPLKLLWAGGLLDIKPLGMLLDAIARVPKHAERIELTVVGDGDSRSRFEANARELGIHARFLGWRPHQETMGFFREADLFALLSIKDLTTNVVFEALSHGLPVLCLDHHGYSHIVTEHCGIKISVTNPERIRHDIAGVLDALANEPERLGTLSRGAFARAADFTWERNAEAIARLYPVRL